MVKSDSRRLEGCRLCSSPFFPFTVNLGDSPTANQLHENRIDAKKANRYGLEIAMCSRCKHIQLVEIVDPEILFSDYIYRSGTSATFVNHFSGLAEEIAKLSLNIDYILEVGSNDGTLMMKLKERNIRTLGVEPSKILADDCNREGLETICGYFNDETLKPIVDQRGNPTLIIGNNVFAHIDDLNGAFDCARRYLNPEGYFIFEVADVSRIVRDGIFDTIYHEHMSYHSVTAMIPFANAHGFKIARIDFVPTHGGSFRFFLTINGAVDPKLNLENLLSEEQLLGLDSELALRSISAQIEKVKNQVTQNLAPLEESEEFLIIGYGAPAKVVTFLSTLGLEDVHMLGIIDDNEYKQNKFLPGSGLGIVSSQRMLQDISEKHEGMKVACCVFPWNLGEEIRAKIVSQLPSGSRILTFFPEVREVEF
jgi:hypothetical protein